MEMGRESADTLTEGSVPIGNTIPVSYAWPFPFPLRFTIGQLMIATSVVALAMAPIAMIRKQDRIEAIVAMVAFEVIGLPAIITILLLIVMKPGPQRLRTIVVLSLLPILLIGGATVGSYVVAIPYVAFTMIRDFALGDFRRLPSLLFWAFYFFAYFTAYWVKRCPECHRRQLRVMSRPPSVPRHTVIFFFNCKACGTISTRNPYKFLTAPSRYVESAPDLASPSQEELVGRDTARQRPEVGA